MAIHFGKDMFSANRIIELVKAEREKALSLREWKHRLAGYGYAIQETDDGPVIATVPHGIKICPLPAELHA